MGSSECFYSGYLFGLRINMKPIIFLLLTLPALGQSDSGNFGSYRQNRIVLDSAVWEITSTDTSTTPPCETHRWYITPEHQSDRWRGCDVMHTCETCSYAWLIREQICRKCGLTIHQQQRLYEHCEGPPKTEYQKIREKFKYEVINAYSQ